MEGADDSVFRAPRVTASSGDKTGPHETWTAYRAHRESGGGIGNVEAIRSPRDHRGGRARPGGKRHRDRVLTDVESTENARARSRLRASRDAPAPPPSAPWRETSRVPAEEPRRLALTEKTRRASRGRLPPPRRSRKRELPKRYPGLHAKTGISEASPACPPSDLDRGAWGLRGSSWKALVEKNDRLCMV